MARHEPHHTSAILAQDKFCSHCGRAFTARDIRNTLDGRDVHRDCRWPAVLERAETATYLVEVARDG